ncbi:hypothetical protein [Streptomyces lacrimifluminis]|uniref:Uncharacterized protein n=1 Tax=Streptomyces lacrimifluminis TaxID=1500077 RepID=A0A917P9V7_9ACTN|nr:hypothetical protein [Streptomyces lacrimifluminis]GGJ68051.1 hypothetical protein GCM10012282_76370 [Streptomyces lacrimifluminis]
MPFPNTCARLTSVFTTWSHASSARLIMNAPPDETSSGRTDGPGPEPERGHVDDVMLSMAAAGVTVRRIAQEVGLAKSTVHDRLSLLLRTQTQRASDEFIAMREVRLEDLYRRAYGSLTRMEKDSDAWGRAWDRCLRPEESLRKLKGADAPEAMTIALERRAESQAEMTVTAIEMSRVLSNLLVNAIRHSRGSGRRLPAGRQARVCTGGRLRPPARHRGRLHRAGAPAAAGCCTHALPGRRRAALRGCGTG